MKTLKLWWNNPELVHPIARMLINGLVGLFIFSAILGFILFCCHFEIVGFVVIASVLCMPIIFGLFATYIHYVDDYKNAIALLKYQEERRIENLRIENQQTPFKEIL